MLDQIAQMSLMLGGKCEEAGVVCTTAESCTGGMVAAAITDVAGSSAWFDRGFVTYANAAKMQMLCVKRASLESFGAVSEEVAAEMVVGALSNSEAQLGVSITGIAGPGGGSKEKPVGTVCFAWSRQPGNSVYTLTRHLTGNRQQVRLQASTLALEGLIALVDGTITNFMRSKQ